jgi:hypothetical protein
MYGSIADWKPVGAACRRKTRRTWHYILQKPPTAINEIALQAQGRRVYCSSRVKPSSGPISVRYTTKKHIIIIVIDTNVVTSLHHTPYCNSSDAIKTKAVRPTTIIRKSRAHAASSGDLLWVPGQQRPLQEGGATGGNPGESGPSFVLVEGCRFPMDRYRPATCNWRIQFGERSYGGN